MTIAQSLGEEGYNLSHQRLVIAFVQRINNDYQTRGERFLDFPQGLEDQLLKLIAEDLVGKQWVFCDGFVDRVFSLRDAARKL
jgi:hypothetical protein